jgi:hypothetical protein
MTVYVGMPPGYPDLATVRAYVRVPATSLPDDDLERMMIAAATSQADGRNIDRGQDTDTGERAPALVQAFLRRVQRQIAGKNLPIGMVGVEASEFGPTGIALDNLIYELERPYVLAVVG